MKAVVWHGKEDVRVDNVPDPMIQEPTDAIVRITSTAVCGSDLHLYAKLSPIMREGDIVGHEPMGVVEEVGKEVEHIAPGDRVVVPFNISCGHCYFCGQQLYSQCETTRDRGKLAQAASLLGRGKGASLFGYTHVYGAVPGGQAEYLRVPQAHFGPIKVPEGPPDERFLYLSDVLPTSWQAVAYADVPEDGTLGIWGLGPIGQMCARIALHQGAGCVIGVDTVPERLSLAAKYGVETIDFGGVAVAVVRARAGVANATGVGDVARAAVEIERYAGCALDIPARRRECSCAQPVDVDAVTRAVGRVDIVEGERGAARAGYVDRRAAGGGDVVGASRTHADGTGRA